MKANVQIIKKDAVSGLPVQDGEAAYVIHDVEGAWRKQYFAKATLAEMLARMENRGLVRREHDAADKRRRFVWLTAEGEKVLAAAIPIGDSVDEEFLGRLSAEEQELFMQLVRKMMNT